MKVHSISYSSRMGPQDYSNFSVTACNFINYSAYNIVAKPSLASRRQSWGARLAKLKPMIVYVHVFEGPFCVQWITFITLRFYLSSDPSATEKWRELTCRNTNEGGLFAIKMDSCDITSEGNCSKRLIKKKLLKNVCSVSHDDGVSIYTCLISHKFTGSACCYFNDAEISCLPSESK